MQQRQRQAIGLRESSLLVPQDLSRANGLWPTLFLLIFAHLSCCSLCFICLQYPSKMSLTRAAAAADARKAMDKKVVALFRKMCREAPNVRVSYIIDESPALIRKMVGLAFRRNANVTDPRIVSMLLAKGEMELEETRNQ